VRLRIDRGVEVGSAVRASVRLRTLLGKKFVDLADRGTGAALGDGDRIPLEQTAVATDVDTLLNAAEPVVAETDVDSINAVLGSFDTVLAGRGPQLREALTGLDRLSGTLAARRGEVERLLQSTATLGSALDRRGEELGGTVDDMAVLLDTLAARQGDLVRLVDGVASLSASLTPLLQRNEANLDAALDAVVSTVAMLDAERDRLDLALTQLPVLAERFYETTREGSWVNVYIVGLVATPFLTQPVDMGSSETGEPGVSGGPPRLQVDPGVLQLVPEEIEVFGVTIDRGDNRTIDPPEGYGR
jgi:phospholipid/cholesterol/gamma-HCH transport system substrate-binding protein